MCYCPRTDGPEPAGRCAHQRYRAKAQVLEMVCSYRIEANQNYYSSCSAVARSHSSIFGRADRRSPDCLLALQVDLRHTCPGRVGTLNMPNWESCKQLVVSEEASPWVFAEALCRVDTIDD